MENVQQAILIAGGILLAVLILSVGTGLYIAYNDAGLKYEQVIESVNINKYNSQFEPYIGRNNITAHEVITVVNLAKKEGNDVKVEIERNYAKITITTNEKFLRDYLDYTFSCNVSSYDSNGKITSIKFTSNK